MNNPTDTNQASEDRMRSELAQFLESSYQDGAVMATRPNSGYHKRVDEFTDKILELIRTEKLKLLAEVRERVVGEDIKLPEILYAHTTDGRLIDNDEVQHRVAISNAILADQRIKLTKLEAEL